MEQNAKDIFDCAQKYADGAMLLSTHNGDHLHLPAVLCATFSIELLLKCLVTTQSNGSKQIKFTEHKFTKLFDMLTPENQKAVSSEYCHICGLDTVDFRSVLENNGDNSFVDWRYSFEKNLGERTQMAIDQQTLANITNAIGKSVAKFF